MRRFILILAFMLGGEVLCAAGVILHKHGAVVWSQNIVINGSAGQAFDRSGVLLVNGVAVPFTVASPADTFSVPIRIGEGKSAVVARVDSAGVPIYSDTLQLTLGYDIRPDIFAYATVSGRTVQLHAATVSNEDSSTLSFAWSADGANPASLSLSNGSDSLASCSIPVGTAQGEYYFTVAVISSHGATVRARTLVTVDSASIRPFDIRTDHARWIDSAIIYGVTPSIFVQFGQFADITAKIPELAQLGVTALWVQPVFSTHDGGQGYDVIDYFSIRGDVGSESSLRTLVQTAHANGLKVLLDFVPNHTSIYHPYAQDAIQYGSSSHYYDFYQREMDATPYSSNYHVRTVGAMTFIDYFWPDLPNLNYSNPEVQKMISEAGRYWIEHLDIDGYRVDAVWAVNARNPGFMQQWRLALKRLKPEVLLLAEDKASVIEPDPSGRVSPFGERFDAAYDWSREEGWVSHWVWEAFYSSNSNPTIFNNTTETQRVQALRNSLTNNGAGYSPNAIIFRFMENNDTFRFLATHDLARTKMAAGLLFSLTGIPLIFNGQEIGAATHPYSAFSIFNRTTTIKSQDSYGLFPYYARLAQLRKQVAALHSPDMQETVVSPSASVYAFRRWSGAQNVFTLINMRSLGFPATLSVPVTTLGLDTTRTYYLTDLVNGEVFSGKPSSLASTVVPMSAYTTRILLLADSVVTITSLEQGTVAERPTEFTLAQNYPNPFNASTVISYELPAPSGVEGPVASRVKLVVYDILGREVETLVRGELAPGAYTARFDGSRYASGVYIYRLQFGNQSIARKMVLLR